MQADRRSLSYSTTFQAQLEASSKSTTDKYSACLESLNKIANDMKGYQKGMVEVLKERKKGLSIPQTVY